MRSATPERLATLLGALPTGRPLAHLAAPVSTLAFWAAIALPVLYLPLFLAGLETTADLGLFLGLFGSHVVALLLGHTHEAA